MKTISRPLRLAAVSLLAAVCATLALPGAASASAAPKPGAAVSQVGNRPPAGAVVVQMTFVPAKAAAGRIAPANTVYGNCGSSWFALGNLSAGQARASFGFDIDYKAIAYAWTSVVAGTHIVVNRSGAGTLALKDSWDGGFTATVGDGFAFGSVELIATLPDDEGSCVSDGPSGSAIIT